MINRFLEKIGFGENSVDVRKTIDAFTKEMETGMETTPPGTGIMMLPTYIAAKGELTADEPVTILDAGGTNLRVARVVFDKEGKACVLENRNSLMPGRDKAITAKEMFMEFAKALRPMLCPSGKVVICFSYAFLYRPDGDGMILGMSKEVNVTDCQGKLLGAGVKEALRELGVQDEISIKVINDTDAVLISALTTGAKDVIGFILGTGTNTAYIENSDRIKKINDASTPRMSVNMESGGFGSGPMNDIDRIVDEESNMKGVHVHEKMMAGAYLGRIIVLAMIEAGKSGLVSGKTAERFAEYKSVPMALVGALMADAVSSLDEVFADNDEKEVFKRIVRAVEERSGKLAAVNLAAVILRMRENGVTDEITIAENGSTFEKNEIIRSTCMDELAAMSDELGSFRFVHLENDTLVGTAAAAFLA